MKYLTKEELIAKIQGIEWDDFEAKASKTQLPSDVWPTVSSFSNTSGGWILCGVAQHGKKFEIEGVDDPQKIETDFNTTLRNGKFNQVLVAQNRKFEVDGKMIVGFYVPSSNLKPIWFNSPKNTYIRVGSTDQHATDLEVMALYHDQSFGIKSDQTVEGTSFEDINPTSFDTYRRCIRYDNPTFVAANATDEEFCYETGIMSRKSKRLTYAGLVMLGKKSSIQEYLPAFWVDYIEIPGTSYDDASQPYIFRMQEQENIWEYYNTILQRLRLYCDNPMYFTPSGASPEDESQLYALKEGLVNFLAHSDLFSPMHPTIRVFFDRIEFQNPGGFHISLEKAMTEIVSQPRNPILIKLFRFAKLGENAGYGIKRMKKWTALTGGNVDFKSELTHTTVTYWRTEKSGFEHNSAQGSTNVSTQNSTKVSTKVSTKKRRELVYEKIKADVTIAAKAIAKELNVSERTIQNDISKLKEEGKIDRKGGDRGGYYVILK